MKKLQVWVSIETWEELNSLGYTSPTDAVTAGFKLLLDTPRNTPKNSQDTTALEATIEGLQMLLQEKQERIVDLKREVERLDFYSQFFKSMEHRRLEQSTEEIKAEVQKAYEKPVSKARSTPAGKETIKKICKNCGAEFDAQSPKAETCSSKCRAAFYRKSRKER
ncbi:hypothetical protein MSTHT_1312 [Methanosarcina thermophila TM-1]|nr:hypothetical protein MSTHT_1312 [Methanosarcina thermophila TM-1]